MASFFRNATIGLKVALAPGFAILCLLVVSVVSVLAIRNLTAELQSVGVEGVAQITDANALAQQLTELHQQVYQSMTWEAVGQRADKIKALDEGLLKQLKAFEVTAQKVAADERLDPPQRVAMQAFVKGFAVYAKSVTDTLDIKSAGVATAASYVVTLDGQYKENQALIRTFVQSELQDTEATLAAASKVAQRSQLIVASLGVVALLLALLLTVALARAISQPLGTAAAMASQLAQGNLTQRSADTSSDATGRVLKALGDVSSGLNGMVVDIRATADEIDTASSEIASGNGDLSARTESTASALEQAAASIEELTATVRTSADNAQTANHLARDASSVAREGGEMVQAVVQTMDRINSQAKKIGEIIGTIDGIAFQTNILALNAAVEAARAGEQGRGFSVVASEVRLLAQRSSEAAREIRTLIGSSVEQIDAGVHTVQAAGQTMDRIVAAIEQVAGTVDGIARAASEQASGIAQVNQTVSEMERATQQNAAMVEEASAATESLRQQSQRLVGLLSRFQTV